MRTAIVRFERTNADDEEFAVDNFPGSKLETALVEQFKLELSENEKVKGRWQLLTYRYTEETLWCWVAFEIPDDQPSTTLIEEIQYGYDYHGMNGFFDILDAQPEHPGDKLPKVEDWAGPENTVERLFWEREGRPTYQKWLEIIHAAPQT